ncbi:RNA polymerase sigma factor [Marinoscillum sp.]|uniref:RNA polymerase sigma factor n=1 Tax=Marinoscillum sp. TaxID=2024838 RepID=UPI003BA88DF5
MKFISSNTDSQTDETLLIRYRKTGDKALIGVLFNRYVHLVYGLCLKYLKDRPQAQDAVMAVFESLMGKLQNHEVRYFKSWLYMVAKNHCLMELRKAGTSENLNGSVVENEVFLHPIEEAHADIDDDLEAMEKCLEQLRADQQRCVRLFYLQELSYEEVSKQTSFALKKVKSYIQNGKRNLKICIEKQHVDR